MELELMVLADYALVSKEGKLSILGIFDQLFVKKIPSKHAKMFLVGVVKGEPASVHSIEFTLHDPAGEIVIPKQSVAVKLGSSGRSNIIIGITEVPIKTTGEYKMELSADGNTLGSKELSVFEANSDDDDIPEDPTNLPN